LRSRARRAQNADHAPLRPSCLPGRVVTLALERRLVNGRRTSVVVGGDGPPIVFLHGGGIVEGFECFLPLTTRYRFIAPQMPGFNGTSLDPAPASIDDLVAHTHALAGSSGLDSFVLVGHSLGGWLAAAFAAEHPELVSRLVLTAPFGLDVPEHRGPPPASLTRAELYAALTNDPSIFDAKVPAGAHADFDAARELEQRAVGGFIPGPGDPSLPARLGRLSMPILIQWGTDDKIIPVGNLAAWRAALPHADVTVYRDVGHLVFHERRDAVDELATFGAKEQDPVR
jgi:pimeloyl-ACP methyl ester carboxylesterase